MKNYPPISVILPVFNEERTLVQSLEAISTFLPPSSDILVVDDASTDNTSQVARNWGATVLQLKRNTKKEGATKLGLLSCKHSTALVMDADLEHPPELIPQLLATLNCVDIAEGEKAETPHAPKIRSLLNKIFHFSLGNLSGIPLGPGASDFKALGPKALQAYRKTNPHPPFFRLDTHKLNLTIAQIPFQCSQRQVGETRWRASRLLRLAIQAFRNGLSK